MDRASWSGSKKTLFCPSTDGRRNWWFGRRHPERGRKRTSWLTLRTGQCPAEPACRHGQNDICYRATLDCCLICRRLINLINCQNIKCIRRERLTGGWGGRPARLIGLTARDWSDEHSVTVFATDWWRRRSQGDAHSRTANLQRLITNHQLENQSTISSSWQPDKLRCCLITTSSATNEDYFKRRATCLNGRLRW